MKIFKLCMKYTINYKLMPSWNKCYAYLSAGQSFIKLKDELEAVKLDLDFKGNFELIILNYWLSEF